MKEIFKIIPGYINYQASSLGRIKSTKSGNDYILKQIRSGNYLYVNLCKDGKMKTFTVHQLIAITFLNHVPNGHKLVVDHINNIKTDNYLCNLQIITNRENVSKGISVGTSKYIGVDFVKANRKWRARIDNRHIGYYTDELDAHKAYQKELLTKLIQG